MYILAQRFEILPYLQGQAGLGGAEAMAPLTSSQMELCNTGPVLLTLLILQEKTEIQIFMWNLPFIKKKKTLATTIISLYMNTQVANFKKRECTFYQRQVWVKLQLVLLSYCWRSFSSTISHLLSLLQSVTLLACSFSASPCFPAVVLYCCAFQGSVL